MSLIELVQVNESERPLLVECLNKYLRELAAYQEQGSIPTDASSYEYLPLYWTESGRYPFFLAFESERIGFVLIRQLNGSGIKQIAEFYIRPEYRRRGLGRAALTEICHRFPGPWEIEVHSLNEGAKAFWSKCISEVSVSEIFEREIGEGDVRRTQYRFESNAA